MADLEDDARGEDAESDSGESDGAGDAGALEAGSGQGLDAWPAPAPPPGTRIAQAPVLRPRAGYMSKEGECTLVTVLIRSPGAYSPRLYVSGSWARSAWSEGVPSG